MSDWEIVRRPRLESHSGSGADPSQDWRRFVLDQVGYDDVARDRVERRTMRRLAFRRFLGGVLLGLIIFALAFAIVIAAQCWRAGRFDRYLPKASEPAEGPPPPSSRWTRTSATETIEGRDTHVLLQNPLAPPPRASSSSADDDGGSAPAEATAGDGDN